jgi:ATP-binding cassette, subfamily B, multidrug efflux pump
MKGKKLFDRHLVRRLFPYMKKHISLVLFSFLFLLIVDVCSVLKPYIIKFGIDNNIMNNDIDGLIRTVIFLGIVLFSEFLFQFIFTYSIQYLGQYLIFNIRMDLFAHMTSLSNEFFDKTPVGTNLASLTNDVEAVRQFISEGIVTIMGDLLKIFFILIAMVLVNAQLAFIAFITIPFFILVTIYFRKTVRTGYRGVRQANAEINTSLVESLTGAREISLYEANGKCLSQFQTHNRKYLFSFLKVIHAYAIYFPVIETISTIGMLLILLYSHFFLGTRVHIGEVFAFFSYIHMFFRPLRAISEKFNIFQSAMAAAERIFKLKDQEVTIKNPHEPVAVTTAFQGNISFSGVSFHYQEGTEILHNISFTIQKGEKIAVVGYTGSGKTTLINLLNRLYDVNAGSITIDGTDIRSFLLSDLRSRIATVPQNLFLFTGTIADNISMHQPEITREEVIDAAKAVGAHTFIQKLPRGYDQEIYEEGKFLSVGQRQLLGCARAFIKKPSIIILDEATSSIDAETEHLLDKAVNKLLDRRTAIIIAHRLTTIKAADRILVIHKGCLVEQGTHSFLLQQDGIYKKLYNLQVL